MAGAVTLLLPGGRMPCPWHPPVLTPAKGSHVPMTCLPRDLISEPLRTHRIQCTVRILHSSMVCVDYASTVERTTSLRSFAYASAHSAFLNAASSSVHHAQHRLRCASP